MIDQFLPRYEFAVVHTGVFRVPPEACYQAARRVNLFRAPVIRTLIGIRSLAGQLAGRRDAAAATAATYARHVEWIRALAYFVHSHPPGS